MKRFLSIITVLVLILGLALPSLSLAAPQAPSVKKASAGATAVTVSWGSVKGVKGYEIAWGKKGVADCLDKKATTTKTEYKITGLKENTTYAIRVRAYYKSGSKMKYTSWSSKKFVTTTSSTPGTPSITGASASGAKVTLKWKLDSRAKGYEVRWGEKGTWGWDYDYDVGYTGCYTVTKRIVTNSTMAFQVRAWWISGSELKYTGWSDTKYVWVPAVNTSCSNDCWGPWSDWSKTRRTVTGNMQEEIRYHWWAAKCKSCGTHNPYWGSSTRCVKCGKTLPASNVSHVSVYTSSKPAFRTLCGRKDGAVINGNNYWYCEPQYRYRTK